MKKIVITGPECSGKSTLAKSLSMHYNIPFVEEFARRYGSALKRPIIFNDLEKIAIGQHASELSVISGSPDLCICDTDFLTIKIWSEVKFNRSLDIIDDRPFWDNVDLYLLCLPSMPWVDDGLREDEDHRDILFIRYKNALKTLNVNYEILNGSENERLDKATQFINQL